MNLSHVSLGPFEFYSIETGRFRLDGGAMFGVVPKTLWSKQVDVDDKNRILMAMRCLLIKSHRSDRLYLIDSGAGTKFNKKFEHIYQLDHTHSSLMDSLHQHGFKPDDVTDLIFTHLHFDHCGGTTFYDENDKLRHTFPQATYHITEKHWQTATAPNAREKASFLAENIEPIGQWNKLNLVPEYHTYEEGIEALPVNGHTRGQQLIKISASDKTIVFAADLIPTHVHLPLPWVMGYDMYPTKTLDEKEGFLSKAIAENWFLFLEHDAEEEIITVHKQDGRYSVAGQLMLDDLA